MLRAAHYKPDAVDLPQPGKSPPKHRTGGFLDLALTAADKYALSLLPAALKGTAFSGSEVQGPPEHRAPQQQQPAYGGPNPLKMPRGIGNPLQQTMTSQSQGGALQHAAGDSRTTSSWDASLREILAALEPDSRTIKPAKLRDHKYPNQNHGMSSSVTVPPPRRELDDALNTLPGGTRRNKAAVPSYTAALKGLSRQTKRPEVPNVDVQYDVVPSVRLAWAGPSAGNYSTTGFSSSSKKYTSQLVGRVSPHYSGMQLQPPSAGSQDTLHLPDIGVGSSLRGNGFGSPSYQSWTQTASPTVLSALAGHSPHQRKALPYVSAHAPSLAKPLPVQYHPVLKSSSMGNGQPQMAAFALQTSKSTPQRLPADQDGQPYLPLPVDAVGFAGRPPPHGSPSYRLPHTPPEIAAEVARLRHAQELDGVVNGVRYDLQRTGAPRNEISMKSKFLQMYEDPTRPLTRLNPKQLLADMLPTQTRQPHHRRQRPPVLATDKRPSGAGGGGAPPSVSPSGSGAQGRSPMYERRLKPLPSSPGEASLSQRDEAEAGGLQHVHLTPPGVSITEDPQTVGAGAATQPGQQWLEPRVTTSGRSTPRSFRLDSEDTSAMQRDLTDEAMEAGPDASDIGHPADPLPTGVAAVPVDADGSQVQRQPNSDRKASRTAEAMPASRSGEGDEAAADSVGKAPSEVCTPLPLAEPEGQVDKTATQPETASPADGMAQDGVAQDGMVQDGVPQDGVPQDGVPQDGMAQDGVPQELMPRGSDAVQVQASCEGVEGLVEYAVPQPPAEIPEAAIAVCATEDPTTTFDLQPLPADGTRAQVPATDAGAAATEGDPQGPDTVAACIPADRNEAPAPEVDGPAAFLGPVSADVPEGAAPSGAEVAAAAASERAQPSSAEPESLAAGMQEEAAMPEAPAVSSEPAAEETPAVGATIASTADADLSEAPTGSPNAFMLPPGITPEMAEASVLCIQAHARGYRDRRRVAELRQRRNASGVAPPPEDSAPQANDTRSPPQVDDIPPPPQVDDTPPPPQTVPATSSEILDYQLPPGVTEEMATDAVLRIQCHTRGYFARRRVAELKMSRTAGEAALTTAVAEAAKRKDADYSLPPGVTLEMAEAAVTCIQSHARGHLARRRVRDIQAARTAGQPGPEPGPQEGADTTLREAGEAVSTGAAGAEEPPQQSVMPAIAPENDNDLEASAQEAVAAPQQEPQELTIDALKAALADDDEDTAAAPEGGEQAEGTPAAAEPDLSDPAAVAAAAAAAKSARQLFSAEPVADTAAAVDQATAEASMARLAASSARTSAMFQGAGAEMRYSDDEASALELMDNLDGLLQGDDEAAAAAAAVAAAAAPAEGELVSISADGVSEPQALGPVSSGGDAAASPMDVQEPGGVRVLAGKYEVQHVVGEGAYGMVMKCKVRGTEPLQWVAIKEFKIDDGDPDAEDVKRTSLREVAVLEALQHPHVVGFVDKFMVGDRLFIVMEFLPCNLLELLEAQPGGMDRDAVRLIMFQLCSAIAFIHSKSMIYRDIKPENLLVDEHGTVKLCDFGFARYQPSGPASHLTDYVATRWYRAPELLLGPPYRDATGKNMQYMYGPQVDMWAVGCLMGELLDGEPLFAGDSDLDQLYRVQQILGPMAPTHQYLFYANPHNTGIVFNIKQPVTLATRYRGKVSEVELSFMAGLLEMDPEKRLTGEQCLQHPYLVDLAAAANALPTPSASMTPTDTSGGGAMPSDPGAVPDTEGLSPVPDLLAPWESSVSGEAAAAGEQAAAVARVSPSPIARGPSFRASGELALDPREAEKVGSLSRVAGSLTRGARSLSRGGMSPALGTPASPAPGSMRTRANLRTSDSGQVVIVEGVEDEEGTPAAEVVGTSMPAAITAGLNEIEPAD